MKRSILAALAATLLLVGTADASLILSGSFDGGGTVFAVDNDLTTTCGSPVVGPCQLPDTDPTLGSLALNPALFAGGDLSIQASVQTADTATGTSTINRLDSTGTQVTNNGAVSHTFSIAVGATDFVGPVSQATTTGAGQWSFTGSGFGDSTIDMTWWNDVLNEQGGISPGIPQPGLLVDSFSNTPTVGINPQSFSHTGGPFAVTDGALFSMSLQFDGTIAPGVRLTGRELTEIKPLAVTNPSAAVLLGAGLLLVSLVSSTRRSRRT